MNEKQLLERAKLGTLDRADIETIARALRLGDVEDPYPLLQALGRANATHHRDLVRNYLREREDPMMARLALQILCSYWGETAQHLEVVKQFLHGVSWDTDNDVRLMAVSIAGEYLRDGHDVELIKGLLVLFQDEASDRLLREAAYCALARAAGRAWDEIPSASRHFDIEREVDPRVLEAAERRVEEEA